MTGLNFLDIIFLLILLFSIIFGLFRGFVKEILSLIFLILSIVLGIVFYSDGGRLLHGFFKNRQLSNIAGFIVVFTVVMISGYIITYFIKKILVIGPLKSIDRILGGIFGIVRGVLISIVLLFAIVYLPVKKNSIINSKLSPYLYNMVKIVKGYLPDNINSFLKGI